MEYAIYIIILFVIFSTLGTLLEIIFGTLKSCWNFFFSDEEESKDQEY